MSAKYKPKTQPIMHPYKPHTQSKRTCPCRELLNHLLDRIRPHYRLTIYYHGRALPEHIYATRQRTLRHKIATLQATNCWMLYRQGPFGLPEREIDFGTHLQ